MAEGAGEARGRAAELGAGGGAAGVAARGLVVGATASDPRHAVTIWNGMRHHFAEAGLPFEYVLYSTYDGLCGALLRGEVDIAWNAPMAHAQSLLVSDGRCRTLAMRDTDADVRSLLIARTDSGIAELADLDGRRVALGVPTSSELRLIPLHELRRSGFDLEARCELVDLEPRPYPNGVSWVDDFQLFDAVNDGTVDAAALFEPWLDHLVRKRGLGPEDITVVWASEPYCHCAFTAGPDLDETVARRFTDVLVAMSPEDPRVAEVFRLEHLGRWLAATDDGWGTLAAAIDEAGLRGSSFL
jgi:phosphonate transport system substrate-binding protein